MVKSIILAAGKGTRMKSEISKVLHTIFDKALVGYVIEAVNKTGLADENFVVVGHQAESVEDYVSKNYSNSRCVLQSEQLGTGHAVSMALPYLADFDGEVIILCGDTPLITEKTFTPNKIYFYRFLNMHKLIKKRRRYDEKNSHTYSYYNHARRLRRKKCF